MDNNYERFSQKGMNFMEKQLCSKRKLFTLCFFCAVFTIMPTMPVYAGGLAGIASSLSEYVVKLGMIVAGVGGVTFGLGWHSESAEQRIRGLQTVVAGVIIAAIAPIMAAGGTVDVGTYMGTWLVRLGNIVVATGGIMFGLGWHSDSAEQKVRGLQTMAAGGIVAGIAGIIF